MVPPASHRVSRVRWYSGYCHLKILFAYRAITYCGDSSHSLLLKILIAYAVRNPDRIATIGLAWFPFARRYSENRCFFLFLRLLRCFSSAGSLRTAMYSLHGDKVLPYRVSPFGNLRVNGYLLLTAAYRSLSRPSSAPDAKSFSLRSLKLNPFSNLSISGSLRIT